MPMDDGVAEAAVAPGAVQGASTEKKVRKIFPESWLWKSNVTGYNVVRI